VEDLPDFQSIAVFREATTTWFILLGTLREFRQFDTLSAISLIADIAAHWGGLVAKRDRHDDPRIIAEKVRDFISDIREPSPNRPSYSGGRTAGLGETWDLGLQWAKKLVELPEDEALKAFAEAFWGWLLTADLSMYKHEGDDDLTVAKRAYSAWCDDLGV